MKQKLPSQDELTAAYGLLVLREGHTYKTEKLRVKMLLNDADIEQMIEFAKSYDPGVWLPRCFGPGSKQQKAFNIENKKHIPVETGDLIFEVGFPTQKLIFIGSVRDKAGDSSSRLALDVRKRTLCKAHNIRPWGQTKGKRWKVYLDTTLEPSRLHWRTLKNHIYVVANDEKEAMNLAYHLAFQKTLRAEVV